MAKYIVKCSETRAYTTSYVVEASSVENAGELVESGEGTEVDDELDETIDRTVTSIAAD